MDNLILVSNREIVEKDDFYLQKKWLKEIGEQNKSKSLQRKADARELYFAYIVPAKNYVLYKTMDAEQVIIDDNDNIVMHCESAVIDNNHLLKLDYSEHYN